MRKTFIAPTLLAVSLSFSGVALAQSNTVDPTAGANPTATFPNGLSPEAKTEKDLAKGEYKARKKVAEANKALNKADCEVAYDGMAEHACKKSARAAAKQDKAEAKMVYEEEKKAIRAADR